MPDLIAGLSDAEQQTFAALAQQLAEKRHRNELRTAYMDGKRLARALSPMLPPYLKNLTAVLGWPSKAVEALARRARLTSFAIPGAELSTFGLDSILDDNRYLDEVRLTQTASLTHAVSFEVVTSGGPGEPDAIITSKSALEGTGLWNKRTRRLDSFLSVVERDRERKPLDFNLYLPGQTVIVQGRRVVDRQRHGLWVPVEPVAYKRRLDRPFGQSRITRPVMFLTDAAMRSMLRMEGTADFYGTPHIILLGAALEQFQNQAGVATNAWSFIQSAMNAIPDDDGAENPRADVRQITQASQQPHLDHLDSIAAAFAGETGIPVSSLGVGVKQANPASAESYIASREDLIGEAEDAADAWGWAHVRTLQSAWLLASGESTLPPELRKLRPVWRDPRQSSRAADADATVKLVGAFPWMAESDAILESIGLDPTLVERLLADKRRAQGRASIMALTGGVEG